MEISGLDPAILMSAGEKKICGLENTSSEKLVIICKESRNEADKLQW